MKMVKVIAIEKQEYGGRTIEADTEFEVEERFLFPLELCGKVKTIKASKAKYNTRNMVADTNTKAASEPAAATK